MSSPAQILNRFIVLLMAIYFTTENPGGGGGGGGGLRPKTGRCEGFTPTGVSAGCILTPTEVSNFHKNYPKRVWLKMKQGKSEGFDTCDRPSNLAKIWSKSLIFQPVWPWNLMYNLKKIIGHLFYTTSSFEYHFKSIGEFKLKLQSGYAQFGSKSAIFCSVWPSNLMDDLGKQ